jgi:predicted phage terminase large subunit-like protein
MDDPTKPDDIRAGGDVARTALQKTAEAWSGTFASRRADPKTFARVIVMQRLHANDLAATAEAEGYTVLKLPMEYEPTRHCSTPWGQDWRTVRGELLSPGRFDAASVASLRKDLGARHAAAQLDQDPNLEEGSIFQLAWFQRRWTEIPAGCLWFQSWDCAFKDSDGSDYVVGQVWARKGDTYYLVDQRRDRLSFTNTVQAIRDLCAKWPESRRKVLVEDKANGSAVIDTLKTEIPGIEAVTPDGGKTSRAQAVTPLCESGQVLLPADAVWVQDLLVELKDFPLGSHDDQVDTLTQAINHGGGSGVKRKRSRYSAPRPATVSGGIRVFGGTSAELERALKPLRAVGFSRCEALEDGSIRVYCSGDLVLARYCVESRKLGACV